MKINLSVKAFLVIALMMSAVHIQAGNCPDGSVPDNNCLMQAIQPNHDCAGGGPGQATCLIQECCP